MQIVEQEPPLGVPQHLAQGTAEDVIADPAADGIPVRPVPRLTRDSSRTTEGRPPHGP